MTGGQEVHIAAGRRRIDRIEALVDVLDDQVCILHDLFYDDQFYKKDQDILPFARPLEVRCFPEELDHQQQDGNDQSKVLCRIADCYADTTGCAADAVDNRIRRHLSEVERAFQDLVRFIYILSDRRIDVLNVIVENIRMCDQREKDVHDARDYDENEDMTVKPPEIFLSGITVLFSPCFHTHMKITLLCISPLRDVFRIFVHITVLPDIDISTGVLYNHSK